MGPGSLTGSTTWWKQVRLLTSDPGNLINHVTLLATEAESFNVALRERLEKLAAFQLQMLRHAMKCMSRRPCPFTVLPVPRRVWDSDRRLTIAGHRPGRRKDRVLHM